MTTIAFVPPPVPSSFSEHELVPGVAVYKGELPPGQLLDERRFEELWGMHPREQPEVRFGDTVVEAPRWHRAYGHDYEFSGFISRAQSVPAILSPLLSWTREAIDERINGLLVNWYDGAREHRIAPHKDSPVGRIPGCPIVTVSFGAPRTFQMIVRRRRVSLPTHDGSVIVIPDATNKRFAHAVPHLPEDSGRRISVTLRGFDEATSD